MGAGRYLDDLNREGLLRLGAVRSVPVHTRVLKVDAREGAIRRLDNTSRGR